MTLNPMEQLRQSSPFYGGNAPYLEALYDAFLNDPQSVDPNWREYFAQLKTAQQTDVSHAAIRQQFIDLARNKALGTATPQMPVAGVKRNKKQVPVTRLINAYRVRGHQQAKLDPLGLMPRPFVPDLELKRHRLSEADLDTLFHVDLSITGKEDATLREIMAALDKTYCFTVGAEYMHIMNTKETRWFQKRLERVRSHPDYPIDVKIDLLNHLTAAEGLERYLGTRYPGTKRFGLEGGESLIPMLDALIQGAGKSGIVEVVLGMAHRGRLNVLVNILGKNPADLFDEFEGKHNKEEKQSGDVKYHQGFSSNVMTPGGEMHLAMTFNPSHLEIASPVVEGSVRARQDRRGDLLGDKVMPIVVHGDAAFAGQGVVMETLQMSQTRGFYTGGTVHIVINNQIGFTTSNPEDARSTEYCTDVVKMIQAPILHVNGDDPEAVLFVTQLALDYRMEFKKDIVIDLVCYRRRGHNEADEPFATQPLMYQAIAKHPTTREIYAKKLIDTDVLSEQAVEMLVDEYRKALETGTHVVKELVKEPDRSLFVDWSPYIGHPWTAYADTRIDKTRFQEIAKILETLPFGFVQQKQVEKLSEDRRKMGEGTLPINWGFAEVMAYGTLLSEGHSVRLTGQDVGRGTFSHRHAVRYNQADGAAFIPLKQLENGSTHFYIYDSLLSEEAVLAFEYGYATTSPTTLVIWEAQFGDFANGAQVVIDQFISSGERKWGRLCGLTLLLPHGYEGQGPEHSSARLERYLQLSAEHNMQVCVPTTPSQIFHLLRRQAIRPMRRPLVVMSPKSLLRHPLATSTLDELTEGSFATVIDEIDAIDAKQVTRIVMCSGKVYYDLLEKRRVDKQTDTAIIRIEQLYPFPEKKLARVIGRYKNVQTVVWCQEEPKNQGAWYSSQHYMRKIIHQQNPSLYLHYAGRRRSAAAAVGHAALHNEQQKELVQDALTK